ncbi:hypothetical protein EAI_05460 [Harpegnathos saltator]|uniref:Uncharacterized protein n=1 Tax=Harpegnathos saltator TaxID=610380 RepID=E2B8T7_HARSA|nr:hypothetical protein EAI_05460 [Harpegnathos saltator]
MVEDVRFDLIYTRTNIVNCGGGSKLGLTDCQVFRRQISSEFIQDQPHPLVSMIGWEFRSLENFPPKKVPTGPTVRRACPIRINAGAPVLGVKAIRPSMTRSCRSPQNCWRGLRQLTSIPSTAARDKITSWDEDIFEDERWETSVFGLEVVPPRAFTSFQASKES